MLLKRVTALSEDEAERALHALDAGDGGASTEDEMVPLPAGWGETLTGEPMPNVVAAVRRSRSVH